MQFAVGPRLLGIGRPVGGNLNRRVVHNVFVFLSVALFIASALFFLSGYRIKKSENIFMETYKETIGVIIGYRQIDEGNDKPKVSFTVDGKKTISEAKAVNINPETHPVGTQIRIAYIPYTSITVSGVDARIINQNGSIPTSNGSIIVLTIIAGALLLVSLFFAIMVIIKLILK